jgi:phosphopantothenoylcysteine synthetase/decarboxylase
MIWKDGRKKELPLMEKTAVSDVIIQEAAKLMEPA